MPLRASGLCTKTSGRPRRIASSGSYCCHLFVRRHFMKSVALALLLVLAVTAAAQDLSFEVASVKPNTSGRGGPADSALGCHGTDSHNPNSTIPMGRCVVRREALRYVIALAYNIPPAMLNAYEGKVMAGPDWVRSEVYNIDAKAEMLSTETQLKLMLHRKGPPLFNPCRNLSRSSGVIWS